MPETATLSRDIKRLRTFAMDAALLRGEDPNDPKAATVTDDELTTPEVDQPIPATPTKSPVPSVPPKRPRTALTHKSASDYLAQLEAAPAIASETPTDTTVATIKPNASAPTPTAATSAEVSVIADSQETTEPKKTEILPEALAEEIKAVDTPERSSVLTTENQIDATAEAGEGVIIQDRKRRRFKLVPAITASVKSWFGEQQAAREAVKAAEPKITSATARTETIAAASTGAQQAPTSDYDVVYDQFTDIETPEITSNIQLKEKSAAPAPAWEHFEGIEPETSVEEVTVPVVSQTATTPEILEIPLGAKEAAAAAEIAESASAPVVQTDPAEIASKVKIEPEPAVIPHPVAEPEIPPEPQRLDVETEPTEQPAAETIAPRTSPTERIRAIPIYAVILTLFVVCLSGVAVSFYLLGSGGNTQEAAPEIVVNETGLSAFTTSVNVNFIPDRSGFEAALSNVGGSGWRTVNLTTADGIPPAPGLVLATLAPDISGPFARTISNATLGVSDLGNGYLVLLGTNFDSLFAGLLGWEQTMSEDLAVLFGTPVAAEDIKAFGVRGERVAHFVDTVVEGQSARVLVDQGGEEKLIYVFVSQTTVVVARTRSEARELMRFLTN